MNARIDLNMPEEPIELKMQIKTTIKKLERKWGTGIEWERLAVWYGNKLPSYLWNRWKAKLKEYEFNWQKFLKLMSYHTDDMVLWATSKMPWKTKST